MLQAPRYLNRNRSRKFFWHRGAKKLGGTMVPGANFSNGTGAKNFQTLAPVPCFEWHRCHTFIQLAPVPIFQMAPVPNIFKLWHRCHALNGTGATPSPNWHRCQFFKWHRCQTFSNFDTGAIF